MLAKEAERDDFLNFRGLRVAAYDVSFLAPGLTESGLPVTGGGNYFPNFADSAFGVIKLRGIQLMFWTAWQTGSEIVFAGVVVLWRLGLVTL